MFLIMVIGLVLMILTMGIEVTEEGECINCGIEGSFIGLSYILLGIAVLAALAGTALTAITNPKKLMGSAIGIVVMLVIFGVSYGIASGEVLKSYGEITESTSRLAGAGLFTFYILLVGAVLSIVYSWVSRALK